MIRKTNLRATMDRFLEFFQRRMQDGILATIPVRAKDNAEDLFNTGPTRVRNCIALENLERFLERQTAPDTSQWLCDFIPSVYPTLTFGESIWSAFLGAEILFAGNDVHTWSYAADPAIESVDSFRFPEITPDNPWLQRMLRVTAYSIDTLMPEFDVSPFIFMDCLNLLVDLRGASNAYMDIVDNPDFIQIFNRWSIGENIKVFEAQTALSRSFVREAFGGHAYYKYARCNIPAISIDAYGLCHKDVYASSGLQQHIEITDHFDGAYLHIHGNGRHLCGLVSGIEKLTCCDMGDDVGFESAFSIIDSLLENMHPIPIKVSVPKELFVKRLRERSLPGGTWYAVSEAESVTEANEIMKQVLEYHPRSRR